MTVEYRTWLVLVALLLSAVAGTVAVRIWNNQPSDPPTGEVHSVLVADAGVKVPRHMDASAPDTGRSDSGTSIPAHLARGGSQCAWRDLRFAATPNGPLAIARVFWNEAGLDGDEDHRVIFNIFLNTRSRSCNLDRYPKISQCADGGETMLSIARRTCSRTTGGRVIWEPDFDVCRLTLRQRWVATLQDSGDRPSGWVECERGQRAGRDCSGRWAQNDYGWLRLLRKAKRWLRQGRVSNPCPSTPTRIIAWGGGMDDRIAHSRGLVLVHEGVPRGQARVPGRPYGCGSARLLNSVWRAKSREERRLVGLGLMSYSEGILTDLRDAGVAVDTGEVANGDQSGD